jgi:hypothetical protein
MSGFAQVFAGESIPWLLLSTVIALIAGFLSSWLTYRYVKRQEIAYTVNKEIEKLRSQAVMETEQEQQERIRQEIIRWSNPILGALKELKRRLRNILEDDGHLALSESYKLHINPNWSITHEHFMNSTLFTLRAIFCLGSNAPGAAQLRAFSNTARQR